MGHERYTFIVSELEMNDDLNRNFCSFIEIVIEDKWIIIQLTLIMGFIISVGNKIIFSVVT